MALVAGTALLMAAIFLLFKAFAVRRIPLLPAIAVNYLVACAAGLLVAPPWSLPELPRLWWPAAGLGVVFIGMFFLTALSAERAGVAPTTVASKMSLVLTVGISVVLYQERPGWAGWVGIVLAIAGVVMSTWTRGGSAERIAWILPAVLFLGNSLIDLSLSAVQRHLLSPAGEAVFPTLVFAMAGALGLLATLVLPRRNDLVRRDVWLGGLVLGLVNYGSLWFLLRTLGRGGFPVSAVFPLVNIGVVLCSAAGARLIFGERLMRVQVLGIVVSVLAMLLILSYR